MQNNENKNLAVELSDEQLDNANGGIIPIWYGIAVMTAASVCAYGLPYALSRNSKKSKKK